MARPGTGRRLLGQTPPARMLAVTHGFRAERASWRPGGLGSNLAIRDLAIQACAERWPRPESARRHLSLVLDPSRDGVIRQDHRRRRLTRGGDPQAKPALRHIVMVPLASHQPNGDRMVRRIHDRLSNQENIAGLKRWIAREVYRGLLSTQEPVCAA